MRLIRVASHRAIVTQDRSRFRASSSARRRRMIRSAPFGGRSIFLHGVITHPALLHQARRTCHGLGTSASASIRIAADVDARAVRGTVRSKFTDECAGRRIGRHFQTPEQVVLNSSPNGTALVQELD
jgi:hypothetical protein